MVSSFLGFWRFTRIPHQEIHNAFQNGHDLLIVLSLCLKKIVSSLKYFLPSENLVGQSI